MKKWTAILLIVCMGLIMIMISACEKQAEQKPAEEAITTAADSAAVADTSAVVPPAPEAAGEMTE